MAGKYSTSAGAYAVGTCIDCVAGKYSTTAGAAAVGICIDCVAGKYSSAAGAGDVASCIACPVSGSSSPTGSASDSDCNQCTAGKYLGTPVGDKCENISEEATCAAANGFTSSTDVRNAADVGCDGAGCIYTPFNPDDLVCNDCPLGKYSALGATGLNECFDCVAGKYSESTPISQSECIDCVAGKYSTAAGAADVGS